MKNQTGIRVIGATIATAALFGVTSVWAASAVDFTHNGFPTIAAKVAIPAGQGATLSGGGAVVTIPAGTFADPVEFELLQGPLASFASKAPAGQNPVYDFAFKVVDSKTNALVAGFQKPVIFSYTDSSIGPKSVYYNVDTSGNYTVNPVPAAITGDTLKHPIKGAPVGWVITSPATSVAGTTSPVTGRPLLNWLLTGFALIAGGGLLLAFRSKVR